METTEQATTRAEAIKAAHAQRMAEKRTISAPIAVRGLEKVEPRPPIMGLSAYRISIMR